MGDGGRGGRCISQSQPPTVFVANFVISFPFFNSLYISMYNGIYKQNYKSAKKIYIYPLKSEDIHNLNTMTKKKSTAVMCSFLEL